MLKKQKTLYEIQEELLKEEINRTKKDLDFAYSNFENALDPDLIDCYIYEVNAAQLRYRILLKQAKALRQTSAIHPNALP